MCVHGLSRQGRDFDTLARAALVAFDGQIRVICPDVVGRGKSDWLPDPALYQVGTYAADLMGLVAHLAPTRLDWIGTSMGGLIGMVLAGQPQWPWVERLRHLVLNDVGPVIEWAAIERIGQYLGQYGVYPNEQAAADYLLSLSGGFGPHTPDQWMALSLPMLRPAGAQWTLHYDPAIAVPLHQMTRDQAEQGQSALWAVYQQIKATTLLLRGALSDLLTPSTAQRMCEQGPKPRLVSFDGVGHAPTFVTDDQVKVVLDFLKVA
jgi:pimeloyl-ACP methyl ester carboxylesterase